MAEIKFNRKQLKNPTPANIVFYVSLISAIAGGLILWLPSASKWIPDKITTVISSILGLIVMIVNMIKPFFGVTVPGSTVPTKDVTTIETDK